MKSENASNMNELIPISALIGDRTYRIKIDPKDEEVVRNTLKTINDKIIEFKTLFAGKDMQDYIAMVMIWYATEQQAGKSALLEKVNLGEKLDSIEKLLDNHINQ
ncbi:MAG TPA: cell division protein ZapA [Chitinophagaceae bacterium]|nr:cell division protein ZapA [Chitinophagaceae bacterium]